MISRSSQFKKDLKRMERRGKDLDKLRQVLDLLLAEKLLPPEYRDHPLRGEFAGSRDCHLEPDWILIYTLEHRHVRLERTGTHSDIFRN